MPKVKGLAFRSVLQAHAKLRGKDCLARVFGSLGPQLAKTLQSPLASCWYPIESYAALWNAIQEVTGDDPNYPRLVGRRCVEQDLKLVHKLVLSTLNPATVIGITGRMFGTYYDTGSCSSTRTEARVVRVSFDGCLGFTSYMWTELCGAIEAFATQASKNSVGVALVEGGRTGSATAIIDVRY
jgi:hypothetical protein